MEKLLQYWPVLLVALNAFTAWGAWSLRQLAKNEIAASEGRLGVQIKGLATDLDAQDTRMTKIEGRVAEAERDISNLPTKADLARVEGEVKAVGRTVDAANEGIRRLEGFFLERGVERA